MRQNPEQGGRTRGPTPMHAVPQCAGHGRGHWSWAVLTGSIYSPEAGSLLVSVPAGLTGMKCEQPCLPRSLVWHLGRGGRGRVLTS